MSRKKGKLSMGKIVLIVFLALVVAVGIFAALNYRNFVALYKGLTTDTAELGSQIEEHQKNTAQALSDVGISVSDDDFAKVNDGSLSKEEIADIIYQGMTGSENKDDTASDSTGQSETEEKENDGAEVSGTPVKDKESETEDKQEVKPDKNSNVSDNSGKQTGSGSSSGKTEASSGKEQSSSSGKGQAIKPDTPSGNSGAGGEDIKLDIPPESELAKPTGTGQNSAGSSSGTDGDYNKKVAELVASVYVVKANFVSMLESFESRIITAWDAQPQSEKTDANKAKVIAENMSYLVSLEAQCDAQMAAITKELTAVLVANGQDTSMVDSINAAYINEKELKKAYFISQYG